MIKIKMIELLKAIQVLNTIGNNQSFNISIKFKFKTAVLIETLNVYIKQYSVQMQDLIKEYEMEFDDGKFVNKDKEKENQFLKKNNELENMDLEINQNPILFDENVNGISANELLLVKPFFDFSEIMK
jgi:hypothetical protein